MVNFALLHIILSESFPLKFYSDVGAQIKVVMSIGNGEILYSAKMKVETHDVIGMLGYGLDLQI